MRSSDSRVSWSSHVPAGMWVDDGRTHLFSVYAEVPGKLPGCGEHACGLVLVGAVGGQEVAGLVLVPVMAFMRVASSVDWR